MREVMRSEDVAACDCTPRQHHKVVFLLVPDEDRHVGGRDRDRKRRVSGPIG